MSESTFIAETAGGKPKGTHATARTQAGRVANPIGFTSTQMLNVLGVKPAGNNYQDVYEWLQRMTLTGISSKGVVYLARRKAWATDTFHVFERVVAFGMEM